MRFGKIKKEAINLELTELISILGLDQPQKEPNWANIKKIEKNFHFKTLLTKRKENIVRIVLLNYLRHLSKMK